MLHLRKHLLPLVHAASQATTSTLSSPLHRRCLLSTSTFPTLFSLEGYLVTTCGLTAAQALKASKKLSHLRSPSKPDAILAFLSGLGFPRSDIAAVVAADPLLLRAKVENIGPRLAALRDRFGLSAPQIARFLLVGAVALRSCDIAPRLEFWITFFGSFEKVLEIMKRNNAILTADLEKVVKPNIELLRQCGLSVGDIVKLSLPASRVLVFNPERVKEFVLRAEELGVPRTSGMFKYAVATVASVTQEKLAARLEFLMRTLGCSKAKLGIAVCKQPNILRFSEDTLRRKIEFLVSEAGVEPEYIVERAVLLTYNLEGRLVPRHYVVKVLRAKGLLKSDVGICTLAIVSEKKFMSRFIDHHKDSFPELADAYATARAGQRSAEVLLQQL